MATRQRVLRVKSLIWVTFFKIYPKRMATRQRVLRVKSLIWVTFF